MSEWTVIITALTYDSILIKGKRKWKFHDKWNICLVSKCFLPEYLLMTQGKEYLHAPDAWRTSLAPMTKVNTGNG